MEKINLLIVPASFPLSKNDISGVYILDYIEAVKPYCNVKVLSYHFKAKENDIIREKFNNVDVIRIMLKGGRSKFGHYTKFVQLYKLMRREIRSQKERMDVVHVHGAAVPGSMVAHSLKGLNIPFCITEHTGPFSKISNNPILKYLADYAILRSSFFHPVSRNLLEQVESAGISPKNVQLLYNPIDTRVFVPGAPVVKEKVILFVGRLESYKGALKCVRAFHGLGDVAKEWKMHIIGAGPEMNAIKEFVKERGISQRVYLAGQQPKSYIIKLMKKAVFLVFPSEHETFGLVVAEAMAAGLPVLVSNTTVFEEYVTDRSGIFVDPNSQESIAGGMKYLMINHHKFEAMEIRKTVIERFSAKYIGKRLAQLYDEAIRITNLLYSL